MTFWTFVCMPIAMQLSHKLIDITHSLSSPSDDKFVPYLCNETTTILCYSTENGNLHSGFLPFNINIYSM